MNYLFTLTLSIALSFTMSAQKHPYEVQFSYAIEQGIADGSIPISRAGLLYSLIGDYRASTSCSDIPVSWGLDSLSLDEYRLTDGLSAIVEAAKRHQIVIISENHLKPQHRVFAKKIIVKLASYGFKHIGLETLTPADDNDGLLDSELTRRGYVLDSPLTGTYTLEPCMADLVRTALHHQYMPFGYERSTKIEGKDRDEIQADNIIRYVQKHPNEKFVIFCGFHHAVESDILKRGKSHWMAKYIKDKTGIDPLTVYQDNFTEKFVQDQHPVLSSLNIKEPSVWLDNTGQLATLSPHVDIEVVHPKSTYVAGRPNWLFESVSHRTIPVDLDGRIISFPIIASAYLIDESGGVPIDRIELKHQYDQKRFVLPAGKYIVTLYDGSTTQSYELIVK